MMLAYDNPPYRKQRILYPLIASSLALGQPGAIPATLILVNAVSIFLIWFLCFNLCKYCQANPYYSLLPILYGGLHIALGRDLAEPLETAIVVALLASVFHTPRVSVRFSLLASLAFLTKETTILFVLPVSAYLLVKHFWERTLRIYTLFLLALPYTLFLAWKVTISLQLGAKSILQGTSNFTYPFFGVVSGLARHLSEKNYPSLPAGGTPSHEFHSFILRFIPDFSLLHLAMAGAILVASVYLAHILWTTALILITFNKNGVLRHTHNLVYVAWTSWLSVSIFFSGKIYGDVYSFVRIFSAYITISIFILIINRMKISKYYVAASVGLFCISTIQLWVAP